MNQVMNQVKNIIANTSNICNTYSYRHSSNSDSSGDSIFTSENWAWVPPPSSSSSSLSSIQESIQIIPRQLLSIDEIELAL